MEGLEGLIEGGLFNFYPEKDLIEPNSPLGRFKKLFELPEEEIELAEAALIVAAREYSGLNEAFYLDRLDSMASDAALLLGGETEPLKIIAILNNYLYGTLGFKGNEADFADPRNSYLNDVIERRIGIPISLSLIYLELGKRLGLPLQGINLPGHFIIQYQEPASKTLGLLSSGTERSVEPGGNKGAEQILLDPFNGGAILTQEDCLAIVQNVYGRTMPLSGLFMRPIGPRQFMTRMLNNLKAAYFGQEDYERALATEEFLVQLNPKNWSEIRDRGELHYRLGHRWKAIYDFQAYLNKQPEARDVEPVRQKIRNLLGEIARQN